MSFVLVSLMACNGELPSLAGAWSGDVECSGFPIPMTLELGDTEDEGESTGPAEASFEDADANDIVLLWTMDVEFNEVNDGNADLAVAIRDCELGGSGTMQCFSIDSATWDEGDDEISAETSDFSVNDGNCSFELER